MKQKTLELWAMLCLSFSVIYIIKADSFLAAHCYKSTWVLSNISFYDNLPSMPRAQGTAISV